MKSILALLRKPEPTAADLREGLAQISIEDAERAVGDLEQTRAASLLDGTDAELRAIERQLDDARRDVERTKAAKAELERRIAEAEAAEAEARRRTRYNDAVARRDAVAQRLIAEYPELAGKLGALLEDMGAIDHEIDRVNADLPRGVSQLEHAETVARDVRRHPRRQVSSQIVDKPVFSDNGRMLTAAQEAHVHGGVYCASAGPKGIPVERRRFREKVFEAAHYDLRQALAESVRLPALRPDDAQPWPPAPARTRAAQPLETVYERVVEQPGAAE